MIKLDIHAEEQFERIHTILRSVPGGVEKAMHGVMTRATSTARKTALDGITSVYDIKSGDVRNRKNTTINMRTRKTDEGIIGEITFSGVKIPLYRFGVSPKKPTKQGVKVPVNIGGRWAMVQPGATASARQKKSSSMTTFENAFIATMTSGHIGMFERKSRNSSKITEIMGASTAQMVENADVLEKVESEVMATIQKRTEHEITRILNGYT